MSVWLELLIVALGAARVTRLVTVDEFPPILAARQRILARFPSDDTVYLDQPAHPDTVYVDGVGWVAVSPHWVGELVVCAWCAGFWISLAAVIAYGYAPGVVVWGLLPFALSHAVGWLNQR